MLLYYILFFSVLAASTATLDFTASTWIWTNDTSNDVSPPGTRAFRQDFTPPAGKTPDFTDIIITANESFTLYVNGQELVAGANHNFAYAFRTPLLGTGPSVFAVTGVSGSSVNSTLAGLLVAIQVTYKDGSTDAIVSDTNWRASTSVPDGYQMVNFDDSSWSAAVAQGNYGASPFGEVIIPTPPGSMSLSLTNATNVIWTGSNIIQVGSWPFRLTWTPPSGQIATSATIVVNADDHHSFYVNGDLVTSGNDYRYTQQLTIYIPPAPAVVFAVNATDVAPPAGFVALIQINTSGAPACAKCTASSFVVTDANWKWANTVPADFSAPGFDDSSWSPATVIGAYGMVYY
ncbi:hypothetical protein B0H19DRAFT_1014757 [Mycena capillaripes]|nr:hypothetical protein B0H19DRAFT_1014757 [Mycena capillaripes]